MSFTLDNIQKTKKIEPYRMLLLGDDKIGKSSFAANAEEPIFIQTENGLSNIETNAFPLCTDYDQILECIGTLYTEEHNFKTVVIDSVDWLERIIFKKTCRMNKVKSIEKINYGKGYVFALEYWKEIIDGLEALRIQRGMQVILISHSVIKRCEDPTLPSYDSHVVKLHKSSSALLREWVDITGYANFLVSVKTEDSGFNNERTRAESSDIRKLHVGKNAAYQSGNRYSNMPPTIDLDYGVFKKALDAARG